ncbi:CHAP domain-containing protein [Streptosporangium canum]|uniref:CHAP domain-containing protein n=1 Tax=Streptosporangium canum TaxID=324952 RepID=UPI00369F876A
MDPIAEGLLKVVRPELGYREKNNQYTKFGEWYAANVDPNPQFKTAPWCDMFIAWAANKAGVQNFVGEYSYTPAHAVWFKRMGAWSDRPEPGALVFYDWSGSKSTDGIDHVGLVEKTKNGKIHTIEANVDKVWLKRKVRDESKVVGYGLPRKVKENRIIVGPSDDHSVQPPELTNMAGGVPAPWPDVKIVASMSESPAPGLLSPGAAVPTLVVVVLLGSVAVVVGRNIKRRNVTGTAGRHRREGSRQRLSW